MRPQTDAPRPMLRNLSDLEWEKRLGQVIAAADEVALSKLLHARNYSDTSYARLLDVIGRVLHVTPQRPGEPAHSMHMEYELWALPVILDSPPHAHDSHANTALQLVLAQATLPLQARGYSITKFRDVVPLDWICSWTLRELRAYFKRIRDPSITEVIQFTMSRLALPPQAPRLAFAIVCIGRRSLRNLHPGLEIDPKLGTSIETMQIAGNLQYVCDAIPQGIVRWLLRLHQEIGIRAWDMELQAGQCNAVSLHLEFADDDHTRCVMELRLHQMGWRGVRQVMGALASQVTRADFSFGDMPKH